MTFSFNAVRGLILVNAELNGPRSNTVLRLAPDTGASQTLINTSLLSAAGYEPDLTANRVQVTTGSGIESAPVIRVDRLSALGFSRNDLVLLAHTLPPTAGVDGVLGLDFL